MIKKVKEYWKISHFNYIVNMINGAGLEDEVKKLNTMPLHLGKLVLSNSKRIMNTFSFTINGFCTKDLYYEDTDSMYIEKKPWDEVDTAVLVGKLLLPG